MAKGTCEYRTYVSPSSESGFQEEFWNKKLNITDIPNTAEILLKFLHFNLTYTPAIYN
jgi:hypothetical protein